MKVTVISFSFKRGIPDDPTGNGNTPAAKRSGCPRVKPEPRRGRKGPREAFPCMAVVYYHIDLSSMIIAPHLIVFQKLQDEVALLFCKLSHVVGYQKFLITDIIRNPALSGISDTA